MKLSDWLNDNRRAKKSNKHAGPMCGKCHRREKHNRLNCPYQECETMFHGGEIDKHPEDTEMS